MYKLKNRFTNQVVIVDHLDNYDTREWELMLYISNAFPALTIQDFADVRELCEACHLSCSKPCHVCTENKLAECIYDTQNELVM